MKKQLLFTLTLIFSTTFLTLNAQISFTEDLSTSFTGTNHSSVAYADIDGDNDQDILITGSTGSTSKIAELYRNDGLGNFTLIPGTPFTSVWQGSVAFADIDGDNDQDVMISGFTNDSHPFVQSIQLFTNDGAGSFTLVSGTPFIEEAYSKFAFADIDGDSDQDLLISGAIPRLYTNDGNGNFTIVSSTPFIQGYAGDLTFEDVDGDNDQDVLISGLNNSAGGGITTLYTNDGLGNFSLIPGTPFVGVSSSSIAFADVDNDNDQDVLITGDSYGTAVAKLYTNDGSANFVENLGMVFTPVRNSSIAFADVDNDNDQDLLITGTNGIQASDLFVNDGSGTFSLMSGLPFEDFAWSSIIFLDVDNDNDQDLFISGQGSVLNYDSKLYLNETINVETITTCQEQLDFNGPIYASTTPKLGQSVTMLGCSGYFSSIELYKNTSASQTNLQLDIYNGQSASGTPIYTQTNIQFPEGVTSFTINLNNGIGSLAFVENNQYSFILSGIGAALLMDTNNPYPGGQLYGGSSFSSSFDLWFKINVVDGMTATTYTFNNGVWSPSDPSGAATAADDIVIESGDAVISTATTFNSITINPGAGLIANATLLGTDAIYLQSNSTSYSSYIHPGFINGTGIVYERFVNSNANGNDLIATPTVNGQSFDSFLGIGNNAEALLDDGNVAPTTYAFAPFVKTTGTYENYNSLDFSALIVPGIGYRVATDVGTTLTFTGGSDNNPISVDIENSGPIRAKWNLIGNPYPSYLKVQDFLLHDPENDGVTNLQLFDLGTAAIYGYDGSATNGWTIYNLANTTATTIIAPGQGFFVSANAASTAAYDLEFTSDMRTTGSSDDFIQGRNAELTYLKLGLSSNTNNSRTDFYFNDNASQGLDIGYDAEVFDEAKLYSHLIQDNEGKAIALQTLNSSDMSNVSIPLGVNAAQGEQISFSISESTLPVSVHVYLDDVVANTSALLNTGDYSVTPTTALSGTGRFFLRTSEDALSTIDNDFDSLNIFSINNSKEIVVSGLLKEQTTLVLYDIQGRQVLISELDQTTLDNRINVSSLSGGVYIASVKNNTQQKTQKVILK